MNSKNQIGFSVYWHCCVCVCVCCVVLCSENFNWNSIPSHGIINVDLFILFSIKFYANFRLMYSKHQICVDMPMQIDTHETQSGTGSWAKNKYTGHRYRGKRFCSNKTIEILLKCDWNEITSVIRSVLLLPTQPSQWSNTVALCACVPNQSTKIRIAYIAASSLNQIVRKASLGALLPLYI